MKKYKQVMSVVRGQWSVAKGYKREDRRQMAGGKNIKTILPSWLLATCFSSRAGLGSAERLDLSSSTGLVEGRTVHQDQGVNLLPISFP
jgi:hypothetical protein